MNGCSTSVNRLTGEVEIRASEDWYTAYYKKDDECTKLTIQPPPRDSDAFVDWMGMLNDVELEAAIQMVSDMWTFRDNTQFWRCSWDELLRERGLRQNEPAASARSKSLKRLLRNIERSNHEHTRRIS